MAEMKNTGCSHSGFRIRWVVDKGPCNDLPTKSTVCVASILLAYLLWKSRISSQIPWLKLVLTS
ncbi:unnamed protein product [Thelazia callipaeda]|uniref:YTH domain-containing protein n=1 Tax=Thelazia callipaeda TaxID=103827 RepID=A0A0N5D8U7_THECL|nr:unnamed protein product [Thelazia callipaeda]